MTHEPHNRFTPDRLRELAARGRLMLCGLLAWLAETFAGLPIGRALRGKLRADLQALRRGVAGILVLLALPRLTHMRLAHDRYRHAPRGYRRARASDSLRFAMRLLPQGRGLRGAIAALAAVLDDLDLWIGRMVAHIERDADIFATFIMMCACADACAALAQGAPGYADSS